jgi:hypothetical protein
MKKQRRKCEDDMKIIQRKRVGTKMPYPISYDIRHYIPLIYFRGPFLKKAVYGNTP